MLSEKKTRMVTTIRVRKPTLLSRQVAAGSAQTELAENALAGEQFGGQADHETEHGQTAVPGFGEADEAETGRRFSHRWSGLETEENLRVLGAASDLSLFGIASGSDQLR